MKDASILNDQVYSDVIKVVKDTWLKFLPVGNLVSLSCHVSESEDEDDGSERDSDENNLGGNRYHATLWAGKLSCTLVWCAYRAPKLTLRRTK